MDRKILTWRMIIDCLLMNDQTQTDFLMFKKA